jgi:hypothetical protein
MTRGPSVGRGKGAGIAPRLDVIPAKAGSISPITRAVPWIPAFAGMTLLV